MWSKLIMPAKDFMKSFIMGQIFPAVLSMMLTVAIMIIELIPKPISPWWVIGTLVILIVWIIGRASLEPSLNLIKEYKSLLDLLKNLTFKNKSTSAWQVVIDTLRNRKDLETSWVDSFDEKVKKVNVEFYDLNSELEKLISIPYRLWNKNTLSIGEKFKSIIINNIEIYEMFIEMINTHYSIRKSLTNHKEMKKKYDAFYAVLNHSRTKEGFEELKDLFGDEFFVPLTEPKNIPLIY